MSQAIIMAGGRSERMRADGNATHKALLHVAGMTLAERNVAALLNHGFTELTVAVSAHEPVLIELFRSLVQSVRRAGGVLHLFVEEPPLGTIGAAPHGFVDESQPLLVVNVDNLSDLDLRELYEAHRQARPWMTIATHEEPFRIPFGQVREEGSLVKEYREKPVIPLVVSSGTYVLSHAAVALIAQGESIGADTLVQRVLARGGEVRSFRHGGRWIDVNDPEALARARDAFGDGRAQGV